VLATLRGIPFWCGAAVPVLFALQGLASGLLLQRALDSGAGTGLPGWAAPVACLLLLVAALLLPFAAAQQGRAAAVSARLLRERHLAAFHLVGVGVGIVLPLLLLAVPGAPAAWAAALARVAGDAALRHAVLAAGVYEKVR